MHRRDIAVAGGAGFALGAGRFGPQGVTLLHPQECGVGVVVVLHRFCVWAGIVVTGSAISGANHRQRGEDEEQAADHATLIATVSVCVTPSSSVNFSSSVPLFAATTLNDRNGLAAMAGNISISST